jgi:tRNA-dependent cyclodipeptide synthase
MTKEILDNLKIYNGTKEDLLGRKANIWLGVSISLKPYSDELAKKYLQFIVKHTKEKALIFIGDEIAAINYKVLEKYSWETSLKKALEKGDLFVEKYERLIKTLSKEDQEKIIVVRWRDVWTDKLEKMYELIKEEYLNNPDFKKEIEAPIITYLKNSKRTIKESRVAKMSEYILKELPFLLDGVEYGKHKFKVFKLLLYPTYGKTSLSELVTDIQQDKRFSELKKKLKIKGDHILIDSPILEEAPLQLLALPVSN